jgi:hypothetical protein
MWPIAPFRRLNVSALKRLKVPSIRADEVLGGLGIPCKFWGGQQIFYGLARKIITGWLVDQLL